MTEHRFFWIFDPTVLEKVRVPEFGWPQLVLLAAALALLASYLVVVHLLDRRFAWRLKRVKRDAELRGQIEAAELDEEQWGALRALARSRRESKLLDFLGDPLRFEARVHEAYETGEADGLDFLPHLREQLGYRSDNYLIPLVSTRQLMRGDSVRLSPQDPSRPIHHYGAVETVETRTFAIRLGGTGLESADAQAAAMDLFVMRGQDLEQPFPFLPAEPLRAPARLVLLHALAQPQLRPRQIRLPLLMPVRYEERTARGREADALDPDLAPGEPGEGVLYDLNDGGFALVTTREHAPGKLLRLTVPLRRPGKYLLLLGRIAHCRRLREGQFMVHATLRGLNAQQRHFLHQVVIHEQNRRQRTLAKIRPRKAKAG